MVTEIFFEFFQGFFLLASICTAIGSGLTCFDNNGNTQNFQDFDLDISSWNEKNSLKGQYFVFILELKLMFLSFGLALSYLISKRRKKVRVREKK